MNLTPFHRCTSLDREGAEFGAKVAQGPGPKHQARSNIIFLMPPRHSIGSPSRGLGARGQHDGCLNYARNK